MKFGETLYQRSIPEWAPYNVDYNSLKRLIKKRTTEIVTEPVSIPGQGPSDEAWKTLENELFPILSHEHTRAALFIRSKFGEIERRLGHVEKQAQLAGQRSVSLNARPFQQTKKYQRLVEEADSIGNDIQSLSRFASAQRLAFRKILKKYRKWTKSATLQMRMNNEIFGMPEKPLSPDFGPCLSRLAKVTRKIQELASQKTQIPIQDIRRGSSSNMRQERSPAKGFFAGTLEFERLFAIRTGTSTASYWIHADHLDEARVLLMRRMTALEYKAGPKIPALRYSESRLVLIDNFEHAVKTGRLSKEAVIGRWTDETAFLADARTEEHDEHVISQLRRKDFFDVLSQKITPQLTPLALVHSMRECFTHGPTRAIQATLETDVHTSSCDKAMLRDVITSNKSIPKDIKPFPHSVLTLRYAEATVPPDVVRAFDQSHLAHKIPDFSVESLAIYSTCKPSTETLWTSLLETDIRKVPSAQDRRHAGRARAPVPSSSGPSSTDGPADSVFSQAGRHSSVTSLSTVTPLVSPQIPSKSKEVDSLAEPAPRKHRRKRKIRVNGASQPPERYWNEFDDDPEFNSEEAYAIYVNPDEPFHFPGADAISKAFTTIYQTLGESKRIVLSWLPLSDRDKNATSGEREGLLATPTETDREAEIESSSDDLAAPKPKSKWRVASRGRHRGLGGSSRGTARSHSATYRHPRRRSRNSLLQVTAAGLHMLSLLILLLCTVLKSTGRRKAAVQVDAGVLFGIVVALACGVVGIGCELTRREPVALAEWVLISISSLCEVVWGVCLGVWVAEGANAAL